MAASEVSARDGATLVVGAGGANGALEPPLSPSGFTITRFDANGWCMRGPGPQGSLLRTLRHDTTQTTQLSSRDRPLPAKSAQPAQPDSVDRTG